MRSPLPRSFRWRSFPSRPLKQSPSSGPARPLAEAPLHCDSEGLASRRGGKSSWALGFTRRVVLTRLLTRSLGGGAYNTPGTQVVLIPGPRFRTCRTAEIRWAFSGKSGRGCSAWARLRHALHLPCCSVPSSPSSPCPSVRTTHRNTPSGVQLLPLWKKKEMLLYEPRFEYSWTR